MSSCFASGPAVWTWPILTHNWKASMWHFVYRNDSKEVEDEFWVLGYELSSKGNCALSKLLRSLRQAEAAYKAWSRHARSGNWQQLQVKHWYLRDLSLQLEHGERGLEPWWRVAISRLIFVSKCSLWALMALALQESLMKEEGGDACRARYSVGGIVEEVDSAALGILYISFKTVIHRACRPFPFSTESEVCLGFLVLQFFLDYSLQEIRPRRLRRRQRRRWKARQSKKQSRRLDSLFDSYLCLMATERLTLWFWSWYWWCPPRTSLFLFEYS